MNDPIVITFDGSVDCEFFRLLKQLAQNQISGQVDTNVELLTSKESLQTLRDELDRQNKIQNKLREEHKELQPRHAKVLEIQNGYKDLEQQVKTLVGKNEALENDIVKIKKGIHQKYSYRKLQSALSKTVTLLGNKNKALKTQKEKALKEYDKLNQEAFKYRVREREAEAVMQENENIAEIIQNIRRKMENLHVMTIVSSDVTRLKENNVAIMNELKKLIESHKNLRDEEVEFGLKLQRAEQKAYLHCNKALEKEKDEVIRKIKHQQQTEFKILQERVYTDVIMKSNIELQQLVENMNSSLQRGGFMEMSLTSDRVLAEVIKIQKNLRSEVATQTTAVTVEMPHPLTQASSMNTVAEEAGAEIKTVAELQV